MVDWEGLLKFSLKYSDGTKSSEFKEMAEEDKKWLEEAMANYCNSEIERIKKLLKILEDFTEIEEENLQSNLEELQQLLDSLDKGTTLYKLGGHITLLKIIFYCKFNSCRVIALQIFSSINQNDAYVQTVSINIGALQLVEQILKENDIKIRENMIGSISALIRGENLEAKRIFIRIKGLELLINLLEDQKINSTKLEHKTFTLLRDLLFYDDKLHCTYNDLSHFNNTANLKLEEIKDPESKKSLTFDPNQEFIEKNQLEENKHFKGCVKAFIQTRKDVLEKYIKWLNLQVKQEI